MWKKTNYSVTINMDFCKNKSTPHAILDFCDYVLGG